MLKRLIALPFLFVTPALAQQAPFEQVLSQETLNQLNGKLQCQAAAVTAQARIKELEAKVKELEEKK
jgi:hypothetical protein